MASSFHSLVSNLYDNQDKFKHFIHMKSQFPGHLGLLCREGIYPYDFVDGIRKLDYVGLPPKASFYSTFKKEGASH